MIIKCGCESKFFNQKGAEFQDKTYGKGRRVHNPCKPGTPGNWYRCTLCGNEKNVGEQDNKRKS